MCLELVGLEQGNCNESPGGLVRYIYMIAKENITTAPIPPAVITLAEEYCRLEGAFVLVATKFFKKIECDSDKSNFTFVKKGNYELMANLFIPMSSEAAIGLTTALSYGNTVFIVETMAGRKFAMGLAKCNKVKVKNDFDSQNAESGDDAGITLELKATSPKPYILKDDVVLAES